MILPTDVVCCPDIGIEDAVLSNRWERLQKILHTRRTYCTYAEFSGYIGFKVFRALVSGFRVFGLGFRVKALIDSDTASLVWYVFIASPHPPFVPKSFLIFSVSLPLVSPPFVLLPPPCSFSPLVVVCFVVSSFVCFCVSLFVALFVPLFVALFLT